MDFRGWWYGFELKMTESTPSRRTIPAGHPGEPSQQAAPAATPEAACIGKLYNIISRIPAGYLAGYLAGQQDI